MLEIKWKFVAKSQGSSLFNQLTIKPSSAPISLAVFLNSFLNVIDLFLKSE